MLIVAVDSKLNVVKSYNLEVMEDEQRFNHDIATQPTLTFMEHEAYLNLKKQKKLEAAKQEYDFKAKKKLLRVI